MIRFIIFLTWFWLPPTIFADEIPNQSIKSLPQPLSLNDVLSLPVNNIPQIQLETQKSRQTQAEYQQQLAENDLLIDIDLTLQKFEPLSKINDSKRDDNQAKIKFKKNIFDFGRSEWDKKSLSLENQAEKLNHQYLIIQQKIERMRLFFEVILADTNYDVVNEKMAIDFVRFNNAEEKVKVGQVSDVDLAQLQSQYFASRYQRQLVENQQRLTRANLAINLNFPAALPDELLMPNLILLIEKQLPNYELFIQKMLQSHLKLQSLKKRTEATKYRINKAKTENNPLLYGHAEVAHFSRKINSRSKWVAGITLNIPISQGSRHQSAIAIQQASFQQHQASIFAMKRQLRQQAIESWLKLKSLKSQQATIKVQEEYRELYFDRSQALYELELKSDIGDAMVQNTRIEYNKLKNIYLRAVTMAKLLLLMGEDFQVLLFRGRN